MRDPRSSSRTPALRVRRSTLIEAFPVEPARSERLYFAEEPEVPS